MPRNLLLLGVGGRRASRAEPFLFGSIAPRFIEQFNVARGPLAYDVVEQFIVDGKPARDIAEPFTLSGPLALTIEEPFHVHDGDVNVYDEGGIASPLLGYWEDRDANVTTGVR